MICKAPFTSLTVKRDKSSCCCYFPTLGINDDDELFNNKDLCDLRLDLLSGKGNEECNRCVLYDRFNNSGDVCNYNMSNMDFETGVIESNKIFELNIYLGNKCNRACKMCSEKTSSYFAHVLDREYIEDGCIDIAKKLIDMYEIDNIILTGGEPFLYNDFIVYLLENISSSTDIYISTNGSVTREQIDMLGSIDNNVNLSFSIDGTPELNNYIRYHTNMDDVIDKMNYVSYKNIKVGVIYAISILNVLDTSNVFKFLIDRVSNLEYITISFVYQSIFNITKVDSEFRALSVKEIGKAVCVLEPAGIFNSCIFELNGIIHNILNSNEKDTFNARRILFLNEFDSKTKLNPSVLNDYTFKYIYGGEL